MSAASCNCMAEVDAMLKDRNTRLANQLVLCRGGGKQSLVCTPVIGTEQIETGRGKAKAVGVVCQFCPFCGTEYPSFADDARSEMPAIEAA